jgi:mannose-6-phosphate isomerase-like protein (cupin superfamily)
MIVANPDGWDGEAWFVGPWNSPIPAAISFGGDARRLSHAHDAMFEAYLVASGSATMMVAGEEVLLSPGAIVIVEPGESHNFVANSPDYRHFVLQTPFVAGDKRST